MNPSDIRTFAVENVLPLNDPFYGKRFRVSATLTDGTFLPCVIIASELARVSLATRRLKETNFDASIVSTFVCSGNRINYYEIEKLSLSSFAISIDHMKNIGGETSMGWTQFFVKMDDGNEFPFGTTFNTEFFDMPEGYSADRVAGIRPGQRGDAKSASIIYREKPFF